MSIISELDELRREVERLKTKETARWVYLTAPLTSTSWDMDARSTEAKTLLDLSAVFSVPASVKAVSVVVEVRDSGSAAGSAGLCLAPNDTASQGHWTACSGITNDASAFSSFVCECTTTGDIYYQTVATGGSTLDVRIQVWGYLL